MIAEYKSSRKPNIAVLFRDDLTIMMFIILKYTMSQKDMPLYMHP